MMKKIRENKGFTLAELLIVVAIIAVLVAVAIPVFTTQLEKAKEATDAANLRSAYAEAMAAALDTPTPTDVPATAKEVKQTQSGADWKATPEFPANFTPAKPKAGDSNKWTLSYVKDGDGVITGVTATN